MSSVSVVLTARNGRRHIGRQLETVLNQALLPLELVVVDAGSCDDTLNLVRAFAAQSPFAVSMHDGAPGLTADENILAAALSCTGRYVAFCNQDDEWHPDKLLCAVEVLEREQALLCAHSATLIDGNSDYVGFLSQGIKYGSIYPPLKLPPFGSFLRSSQVFRRDLLDVALPGNGGGDGGGEMALDHWVYFLATSLGSTITLARPLIAHRQGRVGPQPLRQAISTWLGRRQTPANMRAQKAEAERRALLMLGIAKRGAGELSFQAEHAARYWRSVAETLSAEVALYDSSSLPARFARSARMFSRVTFPDPPRGSGSSGGAEQQS
jgi:hypothetical protein